MPVTKNKTMSFTKKQAKKLRKKYVSLFKEHNKLKSKIENSKVKLPPLPPGAVGGLGYRM